MNWTHLLAVDSDRWACETYRANMPGVRVVCARVGLGSIEQALPPGVRPDILLGGPPCQPFSAAGKGEGADDERDGFPAFLECVDALRPRHAIAENVPGVLFERHAAHYGRFLAGLEALGYRVEYRELDAADFGVPQFRRRVWAWAIRDDLPCAHAWPEGTHAHPDQCETMFGTYEPWVTCGEALGITGIFGGGTNPRKPQSPEERTERDITSEPSTTLACDAGNAMPTAFRLARPSPTLAGGAESSHTNGLSVYPNRLIRRQMRRLTPAECARLQSCPDDLKWPEKMPKTHKYKVIGNGWACGMAAAMARSVHASDPDARTVVDLFCGGGLGAVGWSGRYWTRERIGSTA